MNKKAQKHEKEKAKTINRQKDAGADKHKHTETRIINHKTDTRNIYKHET